MPRLSVCNRKKLCVFLLMSVATGIAIVGYSYWALGPTSVTEKPPMHSEIDLFGGKFSPANRVSVHVNESIPIAFSISPIMDVTNVAIQIAFPSESILLEKGELRWRGNVQENETIELSFKIKVVVPMKGYLTATVEGFVDSVKTQRFYYLSLSTYEEVGLQETGLPNLVIEVPFLCFSSCLQKQSLCASIRRPR